MKVSAGTATKGQHSAASHVPAPRRNSAPIAAKPARAAAATKTAAPAKNVKSSAPAKSAPVRPAAKASPPAKSATAAVKPAAAKPVAKPVEVSAAPKPVPATPLHAVQEKAPTVAEVRPAPPPAAPQVRPTLPDRPPPRPPAKAEIFVEGDHVVYPTHGVGKVERIATEEIAGHKLELIHITFEENRMTLRVPVEKARSAGLRKLATRKLFDEALAVLKGRARIKRTMWSRRAQEYEAKINSGDPLAIAEVVRDLHRNAGQPDQSFSERQIYEAAMDRLAAELAALDKTDKLTAASKLTNFLKTV
jgi:CarD family transcriptional regulator